MPIDRAKITKQAEAFMGQGRLDRAIEEFLKLIEDKPDDFAMLNRVGDAYLQSGKNPEAIEMFKRAGVGFERTGFNAKASAVFKKAHRASPEDLDICERLADLYRDTNMIKEAIQIHIEVADAFTKKGLLKRALEEFAKVVELDPKNLKNKVKLADLYNKEGMREKAAGIYLEVAESLAMEQMHAEANQILERAKTMVSTPQVFLTQSRLAVILKDLPGAAAHLREGLAANPRSSELLEALAEVELQSKAPDRALEALGEVPQLPERSLMLAERALREMVRGGNVDAALRLFKPIGREFGRRGLGEAAAKALRHGLQGALNAEAWIQLAEIAHQSGNRTEQVEHLRRAYAHAKNEGDPEVVSALQVSLQALGVQDPDEAPVALPTTGSGTATYGPGASDAGDRTDVDAARRVQIEGLEKDAETALRNRFQDRAMEAYVKILDLDPVNYHAILRIGDIHKATGILSKVQMHYVKHAERLAGIGQKRMAADLLDLAEGLFPGSTRLYRRNLGLMETLSSQAIAPPTQSQPIALPAPVEAMPILPTDLEGVSDLPLIPLDLEPHRYQPSPGPKARPAKAIQDLDLAAAAPEPFLDAFDFSALEAPPPFEPPPAPPQPAPAPLEPAPDAFSAFTDQIAYQWTEVSTYDSLPEPVPEHEEISALDDLSVLDDLPSLGELPVPEEAPAPVAPPAPAAEDLAVEELPPLELEPLPFTTGPTVPEVSAEIDEELASSLSDIDFQMDYGSPEEAKIEIENTLKDYPGHPELLSRLAQAEASLKRLGMKPAAAGPTDADFEHSFFDLSDVLGDALLESGEGEEMHDATNVVEKIQSVDELFNAFREGVEQQVQGDDYDTHYNLGIAYKEMLLLDPAIEEFKKAMRDPERTLECCSMLSICEMAQNNTEAAMAWLKQGIQAPGFPPEDSMGLHYDLGVILWDLGRKDEALLELLLVQEQDPEYRDLARMIG